MSETLTRNGLTVTVLETSSLGDRSYVVDDGEVALVVDPQRDIDRVEKVLADRGVRLAAVAETHSHNDYVTGGLQLAREAGVPYLVPAGAEVEYERDAVADGDTREVGRMRVSVLATPGHTEHHLAYALGVGDSTDYVFTGGSMLFGAVGRTDLVDPAKTDALTRAQHASVRRLVDELPGDTEVLPTHGFGSFCSATPTTSTSSTVEDQRTSNPALTQEEEEFVSTLVAGLDAYPAYYAHMSPTNLAGPAPVDLSPVAEADGAELRRRLEAGEWVVDLRDRTAFAAGHLKGTLAFEGSGNVVTYLGWLLPWGTPVTLLGESAEQVAEVQRELVRIGIDRPAAQATAPVAELADGDLQSFEMKTFADLARERSSGTVQVLDVRRGSEWEDGHVEGALHIPLHELQERLDEVPDGPVWVHCASGFRATIAGSLLQRGGKQVVVISDEVGAADEAGLFTKDAA